MPESDLNTRDWLIPLKKHGFYQRDKGLEWPGFVTKVTPTLALEVEELS